jgi:hypothetical protein
MGKKRKIAAVVALVAVTTLAGVAFVAAQTPEPPEGSGARHGWGGHGFLHGHGGKVSGLMHGDHDDMQETIANTLGISVDELQASHAEGKRLSKLAEELGVDMDKVHAAKEATRAQGLEDAVAEGRITREQADLIAQRRQKKADLFADGKWSSKGKLDWGHMGHGFGDCHGKSSLESK